MYTVQSDKNAPNCINKKKVKHLFIFIGMKITFS